MSRQGFLPGDGNNYLDGIEGVNFKNMKLTPSIIKRLSLAQTQ